MKITSVESIRLGNFPNLCFVEIGTESGLTGLGETFYGAAAVAAQLHDTAAALLLGEDATRVEFLNRSLQGYTGYSGTGAETRARSAVDIALWDLLGQRAGLPLHDLLGGRTHDAVRAYNTCAGSQYVRRNGQAVANWGLGTGDQRFEDLHAFLTDAGALAESLLESGIHGMKIWPFDPYAERSNGASISVTDLNAGLEPLRKVRAAVGDDIEIMIELHGLWNVPMARKIVSAIAEYRPLWVEDPVRSDVVDGLADVAETAREHSILVATGETVGGASGFLPLLRSGAVDVVTLDQGWTGGVTEGQRIAAMAQAHGRAIAPHDCTGPVGLIAATHLSVAASNAMMQETVRAALYGWYRDLVTELPTIDPHGLIVPPSGPGLGTRLLPDLKERPDVIVETTRL